MTYSSPNTVDILIVGAGPVGLFLANECARRNLRWRIVESRSGQSEHSKALAIFPRTLEIFDMAGLAPAFLEVANRVNSVAVMSHDHTLARIPFEPEHTPYPFVAMVPQNVTESLLAQALKRLGGSVDYNTSFVSLEQSTDTVLVTVERGGAPESIHAAFVVGCDGAHSGVRKSLGIELEGGDYDMPFMLADIETNQELPANEMQLCPSTHGPVAIFPMSATRRRIVATLEYPEGEAPSLELAKRVLAERAPREIEARGLHWSSYFRIHHRHASVLRKDHVFLAGDAAHIHSPFGGQGMNTGLHDVWNLIWKLEMTLRGHGGDQLLDSYSEERLPIIADVIETTDRLTKVMGMPNILAQFLRDSLIPTISHLSTFQHAFVNRLSGLGISYAESPIVEGGGGRIFEDFMRGGQIPATHFVLLVPEDASTSLRNSVEFVAADFSTVGDRQDNTKKGHPANKTRRLSRTLNRQRPRGTNDRVGSISPNANDGPGQAGRRCLVLSRAGTPHRNTAHRGDLADLNVIHSTPVEMHSWESVSPISFRNSGEITRAFINLGISDLREAARLVQSFPYVRNARPESPLVVLDEECGTCSTKHALMQRLANEQNIPMALIVGIYEMSEQNTRGVGEVLKRFGLCSLLEAHCYLRVRGKRIDLTGLPYTWEREPIQHFLLEETIEPDEITDYKVWFHKRVLESWNQPSGQYSVPELWSIREECILALSVLARSSAPS
jgi:2-polyprenyl-6-methoxyphenol hydroxylase-like FAD-dependent oxidoreductase